MAKTRRRRTALASQNRGQIPRNRGQSSATKRRQGGKGRPFEPGQQDLPGQRFEAGHSGNPGGRPRSLKEIKEHIQVWGIDMADTLHGIFNSARERTKDRIAAIKELYDRGYGRAKQAVEVSGPGGKPLEARGIEELTSAERGRLLGDLLREAGLNLPSDKGGDHGGPGGA